MSELPGQSVILLPSGKDNLPPVAAGLEGAFGPETELLQRVANDITRNGRDIAHPIRVATLLSDFSNGQLNQETFAVTLLHDVAQRALPDKIDAHVDSYLWSKNFLRTLKAYSESPHGQEMLEMTASGKLTRWDYETGLMADLNIVEGYAERNRLVRAPGKSDELLNTLAGHSIGKVENWEHWLEPCAITSPTEYIDLLDETVGNKANIEAVIIKAAEKLDHLMHPPENERSILRNIHDAESFYAPICEYLGLDGLAAALRSWSAVQRLEKSGHRAFVEKAAAIIEEAGDREEVLASTHRLLGRLALGGVEVDHAFRDTTGHGATFGTAEIGVSRRITGTEKYVEARAIIRLKTKGALALKLLSDHPELLGTSLEEQAAGLAESTKIPADLFGITIVTDERAMIAKLFAHSTMTLVEANDVEFTNSPSRLESGEFIDIKGSDEHKQRMIGALSMHPGNIGADKKPIITAKDIDTSSPNKDFESAKLTCEFEGNRFEIQFLTTKARRESRIGLAAHGLYKLVQQVREQAKEEMSDEEFDRIRRDLTAANVGALTDIYDRAKGLGDHLLTEPNKQRALHFRNRVAKVPLSDSTFAAWRADNKRKKSRRK